jgi:hypothetical protein
MRSAILLPLPGSAAPASGASAFLHGVAYRYPRRAARARQGSGKALCSAPLTSLTAESVSPRAFLLPRSLVRLCTEAQRRLWGLRLGRLYGFGVGLSYAALVFIGPASLPTSTKLWARALATASWVAGVGALSLARELGARDATQGITGLARLRGFGEPQLERARVVAGAIRLSTTVLTPGLMVALATLLRFRTLHGSALALGLALLTLPYAALVGSSLSALGRACSAWLPGRGRLLLLLLVLGPWLFGSGLGMALPSIPGAFGWLLRHLAGSLS